MRFASFIQCPLLLIFSSSSFLLLSYTEAKALPDGFEIALSGDERGIGYNTKKKPDGSTTVKPTWRPLRNPKAVTEPLTNDLNSVFPDDYYDDYDGEVEGTRRNILLHHTFEERVKTYVKLMTLQQNKKQNIAKGTLEAKKIVKEREEPKKPTEKKKKKQQRVLSTDDDEDGDLLSLL